MKRFIIFVGTTLLLIPALLTILYLGEKKNHSIELDRLAREALRQSFTTLYFEGDLEDISEDALLAELLARISVSLRGAPELTLELYAFDADRAFCSVGLHAVYAFPVLGPIRVSTRAAVILDKKDG